MIHKLRTLQKNGGRIRVGLIGCGAMGSSVTWQIARTPGMDLTFVADLHVGKCGAAIERAGLKAVSVADPAKLPPRKPGEEAYVIEGPTERILEAVHAIKIDALSECTNSVYPAYLYCQAAIGQKAHVVLMNAEVDLLLGTSLAHAAAKQGVVVTSDAGDQHGVLATMIDEIELWGFRIVQAGNMKGFLNRYSVAETAKEWAERQKLSVVQTVSYTDGTKMNIEQALIGNYKGLTPLKPGMEGPKLKTLDDVLKPGSFSLEQYGEQGRVDYTEGISWPGGGVYVIGHCDDDRQHFLLNYYKVSHRRPYYLFFRPYHLCHFETPRAIGQAYLDQLAVMTPPLRKMTNHVFPYAKRDLAAGTVIGHAIGGDEVYGMVNSMADAEKGNQIALSWLEPLDGKHAVLKRPVKKDQPLTWDDVEIPDTPLHEALRQQEALTS